MQRFKRFKRGVKKGRDDRGRVIILVRLADSRGDSKSAFSLGNICRTVSVADAKVSEVIEEIEKALFDD